MRYGVGIHRLSGNVYARMLLFLSSERYHQSISTDIMFLHVYMLQYIHLYWGNPEAACLHTYVDVLLHKKHFSAIIFALSLLAFLLMAAHFFAM